MLELWQLEIFCAIAKTKSFTKAAELVHRTQPTISAQIASLENVFGHPLFDRSGKEIELTESGKILYDYARKILGLVEESKDRIAESHSIVRGDLVIGASTIPGTYILPKLLGKFKRRYPEVKITLQISDSEDVTSKILERKLELGAVGKQIENAKLEYGELAADEIVLVVGPNHRWSHRDFITLDELKDEPFISREQGSGTRAVTEQALKNKGIKRDDLNVVMELGSTEAVKRGVEAGLGVSFVSKWAIDKERKLGLIKRVRVKGLAIHRSFYIVSLRKGPRRLAVQTFMNFIFPK